MRLCLVGDDEDLSAAYIGWLAEQRGAEVFSLREHAFGVEWTFRVDTSGLGSFDIEHRRIDLTDVDGAFVRLHPQPPVPEELGLTPDAEPVYGMERRYGLHWLLDHAPFTVINRPWAGRSNGSKPYQMAALARAGFCVPRWLVTNHPGRAEAFNAACPEGAIYKACSGIRSHVRRVDEQLLERMRAGTSPVLLQAYVPGSDARVHVVGERTFATEIASEGIDYRFDGSPNQFRTVQPPGAVVRHCVQFAAEECLILAGIDFRVDPDGGWWCLESNPVPTFLPYEAGSGHPVGDAIVDCLLPRSSAERRHSPLRLGPNGEAPV